MVLEKLVASIIHDLDFVSLIGTAYLIFIVSSNLTGVVYLKSFSLMVILQIESLLVDKKSVKSMMAVL